MTIREAAGIAGTRWRLTLFALTLGWVLSFVMMQYLQPPPVRLLSETEEDGVAFRGGRIELEVHRHVNRVCTSHADRVLRRYEVRHGKSILVIVPLGLRSQVLVPVGVERYIVSLDLPGNIATGQWSYVARVSYECPVLHWLWTPTPIQTTDIPIMVQDTPATSRAPVIVQPGPVTIVPNSAP